MRIAISDLVLPDHHASQETDAMCDLDMAKGDYPSPALTPTLEPVCHETPSPYALPLSAPEWDASLALASLSCSAPLVDNSPLHVVTTPRPPASPPLSPWKEKPTESLPLHAPVYNSLNGHEPLSVPKTLKESPKRGTPATRHFSCPHCPSAPSFARRQELSRHMRCLHGGPNAVKFECHQCHKTFPRADALKRHLQSLKAVQGRCGRVSTRFS